MLAFFSCAPIQEPLIFFGDWWQSIVALYMHIEINDLIFVFALHTDIKQISRRSYIQCSTQYYADARRPRPKLFRIGPTLRVYVFGTIFCTRRVKPDK